MCNLSKMFIFIYFIMKYLDRIQYKIVYFFPNNIQNNNDDDYNSSTYKNNNNEFINNHICNDFDNYNDDDNSEVFNIKSYEFNELDNYSFIYNKKIIKNNVNDENNDYDKQYNELEKLYNKKDELLKQQIINEKTDKEKIKIMMNYFINNSIRKSIKNNEIDFIELSKNMKKLKNNNISIYYQLLNKWHQITINGISEFNDYNVIAILTKKLNDKNKYFSLKKNKIIRVEKFTTFNKKRTIDLFCYYQQII